MARTWKDSGKDKRSAADVAGALGVTLEDVRLTALEEMERNILREGILKGLDGVLSGSREGR